MNDIRRAVSRAARRLYVNAVLRRLVSVATVFASGLVLTLIVARVFALAIPWADVAIIASGAAVALALAWAAIVRPRGLGVARELDERAGLKESLSTALCVAREADPWCKVVVATAQDRARTVSVRRAIPIAAPRAWPVPLAIALAFAIVWFTLPEFGFFEKKVVGPGQDLPSLIEQARLDAKAAEDRVREQLQKVNLEEAIDPSPVGDEQKPEAQDPDSIRREAIRRLTTMSERLDELRQGDKAGELDAMKQALRQLRPPPGQTALNDMARAMAAGQFDEAKESLEQLQQQLGEGSLTPEQKAEVKAQLENLAEQLKKAGENARELEKKLQQAGMSPEQAKRAATDPQALKEALEKLQNLTPEQKQELAKQMQKMQQAQSDCQNMGGMCEKMAQGMGPGSLSQEALEGMEGLGGALSELEMMQMELDGLEAAQSECNSQLAQLGECLGQGEGMSMAGDPNQISPWNQSEDRGLGLGSGGGGRGQGANTSGEETPFDREAAKSNVHRRSGPIIGTRLVYGDQVRGESVAEFEAAVASGSEAAAEAISGQQVPRELEESIKHYFGRLSDRAKKDAPAEDKK